MDEIVQSVKQVTDIMADKVAVSMEQSSGIGQVNQAEILAETVAQFQLNTDSHPVKLSRKPMLTVMHKQAPHLVASSAKKPAREQSNDAWIEF